jgi:serine phosphatase RsbU (regulator of sigma subunit)
MCLPLGARGRVDGAVVLEAGALGRGFGSEEIALARDLARRASSAIENARLYEERAHIARTLQQSLLPPQLPSIAGIEIAARYLPTGEGNEVGGDFYDVFETTEGDWALVMGDVCGKGADAAALTGLARYTIRTAAIQRRNPSQVLEMLNDAVIRQEAARFCTVAYARLEPTGNPAMRQRLGNDRFDSGVMSQLVSTGLLPATWVAPHARLTVCCGGHPLPLLLRRDGRIERVGNPGTLLGIFPDPHLEDDQVLLGPGDAVVFYTDGVSSGPDPTTGSIDPRVIDLLKACVGLSAADMADRIEEAAPDLQEGEARDDVAILVLRIED